jgi:putative ABC transport system permease protein
MRTVDHISSLWHAARHAARSLSKRPSFALPVLATLALAIAATVVAFSVVDNVLLKPLPYPEQEALVDVAHEAPALGLDELGASPAIYFTYREHNRSFTAIGLWDDDDSPATVSGAGDPETVTTLGVTHEILPLLGAAPLLGRAFTAADDEPGGAPTVILSHRYWQRRFGGTEAIGRTLTVQGVAREIVGVLPPAFRFFDYDADLFYPLQPQRAGAAFGSFDGRALARLRSGVTLEEASADVARMIPILAAEFPPQRASFLSAGFAPDLKRLKDSVVGNLGETLWAVFGATAILMLVACASVVNLVLLRGEARRHEIAIRRALGANERRIGALVAAEGAVLAFAAGALGLALAASILPPLLADSAGLLPSVMSVGLDARGVLFALGMSVVAAVALGVAPLATGARAAPASSLGSRAAGAGRERHRVRHALVAAQVALAMLLLVGSGLMLRTVAALRDVAPGFADPAAVQTFQLSLPNAPAGGADAEAAVRAHRAIVERLRGVNGVTAAGVAAFDDPLPLDGDGRSATVEIELRERPAGTEPVREIQLVSPGFYETLGTPLVAGRALEWPDVFERRPVVLVSENMAVEAWGSAAAALGKRVRPAPVGQWFEVVGVVQAVRHDGLDRPAPGTVALPLQAGELVPPALTATYAVRSERVGTPGFLRELERAVWAEQPAVSLLNVRTLADLHRAALARTTLTLQLLGTMAALATLLGLVGVYGAIGYAVLERRREIGVRRALGEPDGALLGRFLKQALVLAGSGVALGLAAALALSQALRSQLYGVSPLDPLTYAAVAAGLVLAAALASYLPARRAARVDPMEVLRAD